MPSTLRVVEDRGPSHSSCVVVFLPGAGDSAEDYFERGFVSTLRASGVRADVIAVDATTTYYRRGDAIERISQDVLAPAREEYDSIWVVGISMGGGGALRVASRHPELVDGVMVLAPFMGSRRLMRRVRAAGGASNYDPEPEDADDPFARAWDWAGERNRNGVTTPLYVGWGAEDILRDNAETLAMDLPASHAIRGGGGHEWVVWSDLWRGFVSGGALQRSCGVQR